MPLALAEAVLLAARAGGVTAELRAAIRVVEPAAIEGDAARLAFWINLYNAGVADAIRARGMRGDLRAHRGFFRAAGWEIGGGVTSLHLIEHGLLRANRPAPWSFWRPLRPADPRLAWAVSALDPRVHFALNCGAASCPPVRTWTAARIDAQLDRATRGYLDAEVAIEAGALRLPYLCRLYARDFPDPRGFAAAHLDPERAAWVRAHPEAPLRWGAYRWEILPEG